MGHRWVVWRTARVAARAALGSGASLRLAVELDLAIHGTLVADPQVALDQTLLRVWAWACDRGRQWLPEPAMWRNALRLGQGRGILRALSLLASRLDWQPCAQGSLSLGPLTWSEPRKWN